MVLRDRKRRSGLPVRGAEGTPGWAAAEQWSSPGAVTITWPSPAPRTPFLTGAETFHTPSLGDEEFELPPISLDPVADVVGPFEDLGEPGGAGGLEGAGLGPGGRGQPLTPPSRPLPPPPPIPIPPRPPPPTPTPTSGGAGAGDGARARAHGARSGAAGGGLAMELEHSMSPQYSAAPPVTIDVPHGGPEPGGAAGRGAAHHHRPIGAQLSAGGSAWEPMGRRDLAWPRGAAPPRRRRCRRPRSGSRPPPSPAGSGQEEEPEDFRRAAPAPSPPAPLAPPAPPGCEAPRRGKPPKKAKKKKDPNEPQKPVSAYALFFRDTQAAIKGQNPNATFGEVSKIVASMWDSLGEEQKQVYKRKTEAAKKEYLKALAAYRAILTSSDSTDAEPSPAPPPPSSPSSFLLLLLLLPPPHLLPRTPPLLRPPPSPRSSSPSSSWLRLWSP
ncbi:TOX high mobility group box family member 4-like [Lathamus discolor]|uniref:TOX high mobility group box family member 4-like n=1 Tax=Lathamus discolor TaxID=678569 RepID=UPI0032B84B78